MKRFTVILLLLATITLSVASEKNVIVPVNTSSLMPYTEDNKCISLDFAKTEPLGKYYKTHNTQTKYVGTIIKTIDCPWDQDGDPRKVALVKIDQGRLIWVYFDDLIDE